jgi:hypothetical protein
MKRAGESDGNAAKAPKFGSWEEDAQQLVKMGQRQSRAFKQAWHMYCDMNTQPGARPLYDPTKQQTDMIKGFVENLGHAFVAQAAGGSQNYQHTAPHFGVPPVRHPPSTGGSTRTNFNSGAGGGLLHFEGGGAAGVQLNRGAAPQPLVAAIKLVQKNPGLKEQWTNYVASAGHKFNDPSRHSQEFILAFLIQAASAVSACPGFDEVVPSLEAAGLRSVLGSLIKTGQKKSETWKTSWQQYCDEHANGFKDPNRLGLTLLFSFLQSVALEHQDESWFTAALA